MAGLNLETADEFLEWLREDSPQLSLGVWVPDQQLLELGDYDFRAPREGDLGFAAKSLLQ